MHFAVTNPPQLPRISEPKKPYPFSVIFLVETRFACRHSGRGGLHIGLVFFSGRFLELCRQNFGVGLWKLSGLLFLVLAVWDPPQIFWADLPETSSQSFNSEVLRVNGDSPHSFKAHRSCVASAPIQIHNNLFHQGELCSLSINDSSLGFCYRADPWGYAIPCLVSIF